MDQLDRQFARPEDQEMISETSAEHLTRVYSTAPYGKVCKSRGRVTSCKWLVKHPPRRLSSSDKKGRPGKPRAHPIISSTTTLQAIEAPSEPPPQPNLDLNSKRVPLPDQKSAFNKAKEAGDGAFEEASGTNKHQNAMSWSKKLTNRKPKQQMEVHAVMETRVHAMQKYSTKGEGNGRLKRWQRRGFMGELHGSNGQDIDPSKRREVRGEDLVCQGYDSEEDDTNEDDSEE
jgi:hypothetical protein